MDSLPDSPAGQSAARFRYLCSPSCCIFASIRALASSKDSLGELASSAWARLRRVGMQSNDAAQLHRFLSGPLMRL